MRLLIALFICVHLVVCKPWALKRQFDPAELDPNRDQYLLWEDENGELHYEDLSRSVAMPRAGVADLKLYLLTQQNQKDAEEIIPENFDTMTSSKYYDKSKRNIFVVHGWNNDRSSPINTLISGAILLQQNVNVFIVDWSRPANLDYFRAFFSVQPIGSALGDFINEMISHYQLSTKSIALIGHSLGAHVAGCAGAKINPKVDYIVGLDPAGPLFGLKNTDNRIDETDADFVQIIHTNGGKLAFASSIGHADYFPNGGTKQPGCGFDLFGTCAHRRAYEYLAESISGRNFEARQCDSHENFESGRCNNNPVSFLGSMDIDRSAVGDYFLNTNAENPFALD